MAVRFEKIALTDSRFRHWARLTGMDFFAAYGRALFVWDHCTENNAQFVPFGVLSSIVGGDSFASAMIESGLAEFAQCACSHDDGTCAVHEHAQCDTNACANTMRSDAQGVRNANAQPSTQTSLVRIRGTKGRVEWLDMRRNSLLKARLAKEAKKASRRRKPLTPCAKTHSLSTDCSEEQEREKELDLFKKSANAQPVCAENAQNAHDDAHGFAQIWKLYPNKQDRKRARTAWEKLSLKKQLALAKAVREWAPAWANVPSEQKRFCPHFTTYVHGERWEDEAQPTPSTPAGRSKQTTYSYQPTKAEAEMPPADFREGL